MTLTNIAAIEKVTHPWQILGCAEMWPSNREERGVPWKTRNYFHQPFGFILSTSCLFLLVFFLLFLFFFNLWTCKVLSCASPFFSTVPFTAQPPDAPQVLWLVALLWGRGMRKDKQQAWQTAIFWETCVQVKNIHFLLSARQIHRQEQ